MIKKSSWGWIVIVILSLSPLIPWILIQPLHSRFSDISATFTSFGEIAGLVGITMYSLTLFMSARLELFENFFGGMNRVYVAHHIFGGIALMILLIHPLMLATSFLPYSVKSAINYILPGEDWSINVGIASQLSLMSLLILTFFVNIPYQVWRFTHKFLGPAFLLATVHGFFVTSDISRNLFMKVFMLTFFTLGIAGYTYRTLLGRFFVKRYNYVVDDVKQLEDGVVEISMTPTHEIMKYKPGQFIFINFKSDTVSNEVHPFSISSASSDNTLHISVKEEGDFTSRLKNLKIGDEAHIEGAFGRFSYEKAVNKSQIWIAGGIGITPFLSMARSVMNLAFTIDIYYSIRTPQEAVYLDVLEQTAQKNTNFRVFLFFTQSQGRLSADAIAKASGGVLEKDIFICGPPPMMKSLRQQLIKLGVKNTYIHTEEFNLQ
jgi:predicted ferric reductase